MDNAGIDQLRACFTRIGCIMEDASVVALIWSDATDLTIRDRHDILQKMLTARSARFWNRSHLRLATLIQKDTRFNSKAIGKLLDNADGRVSRATFNIADIGSVDSCLECKLLLRPAFGHA